MIPTIGATGFSNVKTKWQQDLVKRLIAKGGTIME